MAVHFHSTHSRIILSRSTAVKKLLIAIIFSLQLASNEHTTLLIKIPTRSRFTQFFNTLDQYYSKLSNTISYHFVISCDIDDPVMNCKEAIDKFSSYPHLSYYFGGNKSKIEACNCDIDKHPDFDILLLGSDDMIPVMDGYDEIIVTNMKQFFPGYDGVVHFNDNFQGEGLNTLPILGKKYYEMFGYVYYPEYVSLYCDTEFTDVSRLLRKAKYIDLVIIEHRHPAAGKGMLDELYIKNDSFVKRDYDLYIQRSGVNFFIFNALNLSGRLHEKHLDLKKFTAEAQRTQGSQRIQGLFLFHYSLVLSLLLALER